MIHLTNPLTITLSASSFSQTELVTGVITIQPHSLLFVDSVIVQLKGFVETGAQKHLFLTINQQNESTISLPQTRLFLAHEMYQCAFEFQLPGKIDRFLLPPSYDSIEYIIEATVNPMTEPQNIHVTPASYGIAGGSGSKPTHKASPLTLTSSIEPLFASTAVHVVPQHHPQELLKQGEYSSEKIHVIKTSSAVTCSSIDVPVDISLAKNEEITGVSASLVAETPSGSQVVHHVFHKVDHVIPSSSVKFQLCIPNKTKKTLTPSFSFADKFLTYRLDFDIAFSTSKTTHVTYPAIVSAYDKVPMKSSVVEIEIDDEDTTTIELPEKKSFLTAVRSLSFSQTNLCEPEEGEKLVM